jgi:large subunit ribosomal protein L1
MELHMVVKKSGISGQVTLPFQAGKTKKVEIADENTIEKLRSGKIDFDILIATPEMMPKLVPFARLLGPKGLMPNPKNGTLVNDPKKATSFSTATVTLKTEKEAPLIHTVVGKNSQKDEEIVGNVEAILKVFGGSKQIVRAFVKSTMSPSVKLQLS